MPVPPARSEPRAGPPQQSANVKALASFPFRLAWPGLPLAAHRAPSTPYTPNGYVSAGSASDQPALRSSGSTARVSSKCSTASN